MGSDVPTRFVVLGLKRHRIQKKGQKGRVKFLGLADQAQYRPSWRPPTAPLVTLETRMTSAVLRILVATLWGNETKASDVYSAVGLRRSPPLPLAPAAGAVYPRPCRL